MASIRFADDSQRHVTVGRTGSGKTVAGAWLLSRRSYDVQPWIIYDYKGDALLNKIGATELPIGEVPEKPGLYICHPMPQDFMTVQEQLYNIHSKGHIGLYFDEGYMVAPCSGVLNHALRAILTQGRSLKIPVIINSQRPSWLDMFVFTEADFYQVFNLNYVGDKQKMGQYLPPSYTGARLPDFNSYYYDVGKDNLVKVAPVPDEQIILETFDRRIPRPKRRFL